MLSSVIPKNDAERVQALRSFGLSKEQREDDFDQITQLASQFTNMPISLVSLVDDKEVWFKSSHGIDLCSSDRGVSLCSYTINNEENTLVLENIKNDKRFKDSTFLNAETNPFVFYAGVCLVDNQGYKLGTLCVIDNKPNTISSSQLNSLKILAKQVVKLMELRKANKVLREVQGDLKKKNKELRSFAGVVSHDMKMPLANIIITTDILKAKYSDELDEKAIEYLTYLKQSSFTLSDYITGLLNHYESDQLDSGQQESFDIHLLLENIVDLLNINVDCEINLPQENIDLTCNKVALEQILLNLIGNSLKYNDKEKIIIDIECKVKKGIYYFTVSDNGIGIPKDKIGEIFTLFATVGNTDRYGNKGNGIGLSTVKKLINNFGGEIQISSEIGKGTVTTFTIQSLD